MPSDFQSSVPVLPSFAVKKSVLSTAVRLSMDELEEPMVISLRSSVPASVPSDFQSSVPLLPSFASKRVYHQ